MSAAEKLKALEHAASGPQTYGPDPLEWTNAASSVMHALPQIVAVVEAAQEYRNDEEWSPYDSSADVDARRRKRDTLDAALAALDEALS